MRALVAALVLLIAAPAAADVVLSGAIEQGGLVTGRAEPGSSIRLDGVPLRVAPDGSFVFGFDRDAGPSAVLSIREPSGRVEERHLAVVPRAWPVQRVDGLPRDKVTPDAEQLARIRREAALIAERRRRDTPTPWFAGGFTMPAVGRVSGVFGSQRILNGEPRAPHSGTDIAAPTGTEVRAAAAGVVSLASDELFLTGKTVMIDHGHGLSSIYAHLSHIAIVEGEEVDRGTVIGRVGASGRATGPHLHWGISWFDRKLDPERVVARGID